MNGLLDVKRNIDFKRNLTDGSLIRVFDVAVFVVRGISLWKDFWVVKA